MDNIQNSAPEEYENVAEAIRQTKPVENKTIKKILKRKKYMDKKEFFKDDLKYPYMKYSMEANEKDSDLPSNQENDDNEDDWHRRSHERARRAARPKEENRNTCSLYIQTDPLIWRHIREGIADVS